ncbi:phosphoribosylglycinamide formyltransferase [Peribacillus sp. B-H-3]|jgi:phosphoribosylglycinamide formyltransferase 1|uniref:phosphoribosylglycinamide formyltransferase n=1 Tax=Peribacillus sp. B-H-3 TaxID=3400420 RepID=UPI003B011F97
MKKIAVFASGSGSNFQAIADEIKAGGLKAEISLLVCDRPGALVLERASGEGVNVFCFSPKEYESKEMFELEILSALSEHEAEYIVLAGYMRLIGHTLLQKFPQKIINIHPSYLPAFPGKDAIGQAFDAGVKETGVTIHYVDEGMDTGPAIAQRKVPVLPGDTKEALQKRIQAVEHELYPQVLNKILHT